jgi:hypothetical protein
VLVLGRRLLENRVAALAAALLFTVHPAHVEAVAWISSRKDLVATAFGLAAWASWIRYRDEATRGGATGRWYAVSLVLFLLALGGKLSIVVLPAVLVVQDLVVERRRGAGVVLDKLPHAALAGAFALVVAGAQPETNVARDAGALAQIASGLLGQLLGLGAPVVFRPIPDASLAAAEELVRGAAVLVAVGGGLFLLRGCRTGLLLALATLLALLPPQVLRFVYPVSDRYLFLATAPFVLLLAGAVRDLLAGRRRVGLAALAVVVALGGWWSFVTVRTLREWGDPRSVWYAASQRVSDINTHEYLGEHWLAAAEEILRAGVEREPLPERTQALARALGYAPHRLEVMRREWDEDLPHRPGTDAMVRDLLQRADEQFELALSIPTERVLPSLHYRRARLHELRGDDSAALAEYERAHADAQRYPIDAVANLFRVQSLYGMGLAADRLGDRQRALACLRRALAEEQALDAGIEGLEAEIERLEGAGDGG